MSNKNDFKNQSIKGFWSKANDTVSLILLCNWLIQLVMSPLLPSCSALYISWLHNALLVIINANGMAGDILPHSNMMIKPDLATVPQSLWKEGRHLLKSEGELMNGIHYDLICLPLCHPFSVAAVAGSQDKYPSTHLKSTLCCVSSAVHQVSFPSHKANKAKQYMALTTCKYWASFLDHVCRSIICRIALLAGSLGVRLTHRRWWIVPYFHSPPPKATTSVCWSFRIYYCTFDMFPWLLWL